MPGPQDDFAQPDGLTNGRLTDTPGDGANGTAGTDFAKVTTMIYVGTAGNYTWRLRSGATFVCNNMVAGTFVGLRVQQAISAPASANFGGLWP